MRETVHKGTEFGESEKAYTRADLELVAADRDRTSFTYVVTEPCRISSSLSGGQVKLTGFQLLGQAAFRIFKRSSCEWDLGIFRYQTLRAAIESVQNLNVERHETAIYCFAADPAVPWFDAKLKDSPCCAAARSARQDAETVHPPEVTTGVTVMVPRPVLWML